MRDYAQIRKEWQVDYFEVTCDLLFHDGKEWRVFLHYGHKPDKRFKYVTIKIEHFHSAVETIERVKIHYATHNRMDARAYYALVYAALKNMHKLKPEIYDIFG